MELLLQEKEIVDVSERFRGYRVFCRKGLCWLTREGDDRDLILREGGNIAVEGRNVIITALSEVTLKLVAEKSAVTEHAFSWLRGGTLEI
jgi:Protein of unknown function (DUF2917)